MINSFQSLNTITSGLILRQLEQQVNANNLSQTYLDSNGYLMNSVQRLNSINAPSASLMGANGLFSVGTGTMALSITRLRSSFLDAQIQHESIFLGYNEILSNATASGIMDQINSIVNGPITLSSTLTDFTTSWTNLAVTPTSTALQSSVVNAGVSFARTANAQFSQLQSLQQGMNIQINTTVTQINGILQQLAAINKQLLTTPGSNQNSLLDARDYALDRLSRLMNFQVSFATNGVAHVWINSLSLVDDSGASILQTSVNNPQLLDVTIQSSQSLITMQDASSLITGGNLGGELYARNVVLQSYKAQVDQIATTVLNMTNNLYQAGYVANTTTTGTAFFTGTRAADISVNAVYANPLASPILATEVYRNTATGLLATDLGNLTGLLGNNYVQSTLGINAAGQVVDPSATIVSQMPAKFATLPAPNPGGPPAPAQFTINGVTINYMTSDTIDSILAQIRAKLPAVKAFFNYTTQQFEMFSANTITVQESGVDNFITWSKIKNVLVSTIRMNNGFATNQTQIVFGGAPTLSALNSSLVGPGFNQGPNQQAFFVTPSATGSFMINGKLITWNNTQSLNTIKNAIQAAFPAGVMNVGWNANSQILSLQASLPAAAPPQTFPIQITDITGNFTVFTGLNGSLPIGNMASAVLSQSSSQDDMFQIQYTQASDSLTQLNNAQANTAAVSPGIVGGVTQPGIPIASIQQKAMEAMITYNAMLQVMQVIDQMYADLVGIIGTSTASGGVFSKAS